jgi:hypothetical protein
MLHSETLSQKNRKIVLLLPDPYNPSMLVFVQLLQQIMLSYIRSVSFILPLSESSFHSTG